MTDQRQVADRRISTGDLDPFAFTGIYRWFKDWHSAWLLLVGVGYIGAVLIGAASAGAIGTVEDFQVVDDVKRILQLPVTEVSQPSFPLIRDVTTWLLCGSVIAGTVLLHRHWSYLSTCLSKLAENGAIIAKPAVRSTRVSRALRIDAIVAGKDPQEAFGHFIARVNQTLREHRAHLVVPMGILSLVLAVLLWLGMENSLFQTVAPPGLSDYERQVWLETAYQHWWAGGKHHFARLLYLLLAWYAIFVILAFQVVGVCAIYVTIAMHYLVDPSADWLNSDGRYGWAPLARFYRTVMWANAILGTSLTTVLASLGVTNVAWIGVLVALYVLLMPVFTVAPWVLFRHAGRRAVDTRVAQIKALALANGVRIAEDIERMGPYLAEIDRCRTADIRPLRMGTISLFTQFTLVFLPIVLAGAQIWLQ
ncbi:hypothetical protein [Actinokineospora globicatena]|uniref:Uncharacterized protein n=1 Tax=Actinokineospora globicatena TaxID=103729 RepID=A0A9W6V9W2_9PSEU|nr:hypothetical protein [Actinokineospora globicatena]GLW91368.1 hypothetical protein Aglo03_21840 [Actinokineospora globicatena]